MPIVGDYSNNWFHGKSHEDPPQLAIKDLQHILADPLPSENTNLFSTPV